MASVAILNTQIARDGLCKPPFRWCYGYITYALSSATMSEGPAAVQTTAMGDSKVLGRDEPTTMRTERR